MDTKELQRSVLPIPDLVHFGLTTYDAKDPDTKYPPIRELRPPDGQERRGDREEQGVRRVADDSDGAR